MGNTRRILSVVLSAALLLTSTVGWANPNEQIDQLRTMLDEQDQLDQNDAALKDRQMARKWLEEAEVLAANGKEDAAKRRIKRVEFAVELVTALVAAALVRQKAEEQEAAAFGAPETVERLQDEVDALKKRKTELQQELSKLRQQNK